MPQSDSNSKRARALRLLASLVAAGSAVGFALETPHYRSSKIVWEPTSVSDGGVMPLQRLWPAALDVSIPCAKFESENAALLNLGGLAVFRDGQFVSLKNPDGGELLRTSLPQGISASNCNIEISFSERNKRLEIRSSERLLARAKLADAQFPSIQRIEWSATSSIEGTVVEIITRPVGSSPSNRQIVYLLISAISIVLVLLSCYSRGTDRLNNSRGSRHRIHAGTPGRSRLLLIDSMVALSLLLAALLTPAFLDDGWIFATERLYQETGSFSGYFDRVDSRLSIGFWWAWLSRFIFESGLPIFYLRVPVVFILGATWFVLRSRILIRLRNVSTVSFVGAAVTFIVFASSWLMTFRSEPLIVFLLVLQSTFLIDFRRQPKLWSLGLAVIVTSLGLSLHQLGLFLVPPMVLAIPSILAIRHRVGISSLFALGAIGVALTSNLILLDSSWADFQESIRDIRISIGHQWSIGRLYERLNFITTLSGPRLFSLVLLLLLFSPAMRGLKTSSSEGERREILSLLSPAIGLLGLASPWPWHFGALSMSASVVGCLAFSYLWEDTTFSRFAKFSFSVGVVAVAAGACLMSTQAWGNWDLALETWSGLVGSIAAGPDHNRAWIALIGLGVCVSAGAGWVYRKTERSYLKVMIIGPIVVASLTPISAHWTWFLKDAATAAPGEWSFTRQTLEGVGDLNNCGLGDALVPVTEATALQVSSNEKLPTEPSEVPALIDGFPRLPGISDRPFSSLPTWGTWEGARRPDQAPVPLSTSVTPWFGIGSATSLVVWTSNGLNQSVAVNVIYASKSFEVFGKSELTPAVGYHWKLHTVAVPQGAKYVKVILYDASPAEDGWVASSAPSTVNYAQNVRSLTTHEDIPLKMKTFEAAEANAFPTIPGERPAIEGGFPTSFGPPPNNSSRLPISGTWNHESKTRSPSDERGTRVSPWFELSGQSSTMIWTAHQPNQSVAIDLQFFSEDQKSISTVKLPPARDSRWTLWAIATPFRATYLRSVIYDAAEGSDGWAATSAPFVWKVPKAPRAKTATTWTSPFQLMATPCIKLPRSDQGFLETIDYSLGSPGWNAASIATSQHSQTEVACANPSIPCLVKMAYLSAKVRTTVVDH